jgi:hypothetical protein
MPIQLIIRNPLDRDAREFVQRAGVSDAGGRSQINEFVRGIKGLGLWDSMVCWPLRSTQNAGTGTTAYSLGGLGTFNGTLVNGPTWGADGLDHTAASSHTTRTPINLIDYGPTGFSLFTVAKLNVNNAENMFFGQEGGGGNNLNGMLRRVTTAQININYSGGNRQASLTSPAVGSFASYGGSVSNAQLRFMANSSHATATPSGTYSSVKERADDTLRFASRSSAGGSEIFTNVTSAFGALFNVALSQSQLDSLRDLYKQTLGIGLSLP